MTRLNWSVRWALAVAWVASFAWLIGCVLEILGWRAPSDVFLAWSVPALPVFVATAEWWARRRGQDREPWLAALVVAWTVALWWLARAPRVPGSPAQVTAASAVLVGVALGLLAVQCAMLFTKHTIQTATPVERRVAVATPVGAH